MTPTGNRDPDLKEAARERTRQEADRVRKALGLTYRDLATKSGVSLTLVTRLLRGPGYPRQHHVESISEALGLGPHGLTDYENAVLADIVTAEATEAPAFVTTDGRVRIYVELERGALDGKTPSEVLEVALGARKGAVATLNEINGRKASFRRAA